MPTRVYILPDFFSLLPNKPGGEISPHFEEAETAFSSWFKEKFGNTSMPIIIGIQHLDGVRLAALAYPTASLPQLKGIVDLILAFLFVEIVTDNASGTVAGNFVQLCIKGATESITPEEENSFYPFLKIMLRELLPSVKAVVGSLHWPRFMEDNKFYVTGITHEALDREAYARNRGMRDVQSYATIRRESVGVRPCFTLIRSIRDLYIPDDVLDHPAIREMENAANDMIWIVNDVYSFKQEFGENGALNNVLTVIQKDPKFHGLDLQGRLDYTEKLFREAFERFHTSKDSLPLLECGMEQKVATYADGLMDWVVGNLEWSAVTPRYDVFANEEDRKHRVLRLEFPTSFARL